MSDIREDIKVLLNLASDTSDEDLIKSLGDEIKKYHPTGSEGEELRKKKTERFTQIHELYKKFKSTLDREKKNSTTLVPLEAQALEIAQEMDQIDSCYEIVNLKERVRHLEKNEDFNKDTIRNLEKEKTQLVEQIEQLKEELEKKEKDSLLALYKQDGKKRTWGFLSLTAGLIAVIPACSDALNTVLGSFSSTILTVFFFTVAIFVFIDFFICKIRTMVVNDLACQLMDGGYLEEKLNFIERKPYSTSTYYYVSEQAIRALISETFKASKKHWLFPFDSNEVIEHVKRSVISHFLELELFKSKKLQKFDVWYEISFSDEKVINVIDDLPFL